MNWVFFALAAPMAYAFSEILAKFFLEKKVKNGATLLSAISIFRIIMAVAILLIVPISFFEISISSWLLVILLGFAAFAHYLFLLRGMEKEDASTVVALVFVFPVFVALLATIFLGEQLSPLKWFGMVAIVVGVILASIKKFDKKIIFSSVLGLIILSAFFEGIVEILDKVLLSEMNFWHVSAFTYIFLSLFSFSFLLKKKNFGDFKKFVGDKKILAFVGLKELIAMGGFFAFLIAASTTDVSVVSALFATQPFFVLVFAIISTIFFPKFLKESVEKKTLLVKIVAIIFIVVGAIIISA
ncbi:MAG: EamA family transporter [Candidatus Diapherotrites archaeon]|nr:EamA family transporter [Candidatus Diapherotrites archaeon]